MADNKNSSLRVNFIMNVLLTMSSLIFPLITFPYVSRVLLAEGNGKVQLATSFVSYFIMVSQLGLPNYGVRACAVVRDDRRVLTKTVQELCIINLVMMLVSYAVFFCLLQLVPRLQQEKNLYIITSTAILFNTIGMEWLFKAMEEYRYITVRSIGFKIISVIAMFALVRSQDDYAIYSGISVFAAYGSGVMNLTRLHKFIDFKPVGHYDLRPHIKPVLVFFAMSCAATIYTNLDSVMLGFMATDAEVGYYSVAVKIKNILVGVVTALGTVLLPRVSYYYEQGRTEEFWALVKKALHFVVLLSFPMTVYFMIFAKESIFLLSGDSYSASIAPMVAIMPTLIFIGMTNIMGMQVLVPTGRERIVLYSTVGGAVADLIINTILIPSMGALGASIGTLVAEAVVLVIQYIALRKEVGSILSSLGIHKVILACVVATTASSWTKSLSVGNFGTLVISAVIFFGVYLLLMHLLRDPLVRELENQLIGKLKRK